MTSRLKTRFQDWLHQTPGGIAMYMALMIPVLTGVVGMAIDVSESYLMRERLTRALDAAALAVAGSTTLETQDQMQDRVNDFMAANYPPDKIGSPYDIDVVVEGDFVTVSAKAKYDTTFLRFLGFDQIDTIAHTKVERKIKGIEVALVLDNTGSMSYKPSGATKTNIQALKDSSTDFINIMFSKAKKPEDVRIALVPYANTVRIGLYGLGKIPNPLTGVSTGSYDEGGFVTLPDGMTDDFYKGNTGTTKTVNGAVTTYNFNSANSDHDNINKSKWYGCVIEHRDGGWDIDSSDNDPHPNDVTDDYTGPWEIYQYGSQTYGCVESHNVCTKSTCTQSHCSQWHCTSGGYNSDGSCKKPSKMVCDVTVCDVQVCQKTTNVCDAYAYGYSMSTTPNNSCPYANVMPLSSNKGTLLDTVGTMQAHGNTQGNTGMIWGYRMISPEAPFTEGSEWGSLDWKKAIVMMTDGDNTWDANYSEYWLSKRSASMNETTLDDRFKEVCETLKDDRHVLVYTVVFKSETAPTQATKDMYKNCATNPDTMYFYAPTQAKLKEVFDQIAHELSNLRIAE